MHFSAPLTDYEPLLEGILTLLDFVGKSGVSAKFTFISTVGVYYRMFVLLQLHVPCSFTKGPIASFAPEAPILDPKVVISAGYPESKWIAERLLQIAAKELSLKTSIIRVGLLTGSPSGCWDTSQWFPSLVQSAEYIGCLPAGDEVSSVIPLLAACSLANRQFHGFNPRLLLLPLSICLRFPTRRYISSIRAQCAGLQ